MRVYRSDAVSVGCRSSDSLKMDELADEKRGCVLADTEWIRTRDRLVQTIVRLGFREELGLAIAKNLGSPKAMDRMISYLVNVKPKKEELVIDEMLAICSEIAAWKEKKASEEANARYNEMLCFGLGEK